MNHYSCRRGVVFHCLMLTLMALFSQESSADQIMSSAVPASGQNKSSVKITLFGRYAISVHSQQGLQLRLVDRMSGPGPASGSPGEQDGRLDVFLDRGEYQVLTQGTELMQGQAQLRIHSFKEHNTPVPLLIPHKLIADQLHDFEQRSYWLEIKKRQTVILEAAGRSLGDLRLWHEGNFLVAAQARVSEIEPQAGQVLTLHQLVTVLDPGFYLVTAYGAKPIPWPQKSDVAPFWLRYDAPKLPEAGRQRFVMSPLGVDHFLVPKDATFFQLALFSPHQASLQVQDFDEQQLQETGGYIQVLNKDSALPVAEIELSKSNRDYHWVTVKMEAGKAYVLQHFERRWQAFLKQSGQYWISTLRAGDPEDMVDTTALIIQHKTRFDEGRFFDAEVIKLNAKSFWKRRMNALETLTVFVEITEKGSYRVHSEEIPVKVKIDRFFIQPPQNFRESAWRKNGHLFELDPGYYTVQLQPTRKGVLTVRMEPEKIAPDAMALPQLSMAQFPQVNLDADDDFSILFNGQTGVAGGFILRPLPINLSEALPVRLHPGQNLTVPVKTSEKGVIKAVNQAGQNVPIAIAGGKNKTVGANDDLPLLEAGEYPVSIQGTEKSQILTLSFSPAIQASTTPLPVLSLERLSHIKQLPMLEEKTPRFMDLERNNTATFQLKVDKPALYRLESTGLLQTIGNLRTRVNPALFSQDANGVGGNFLIQQYLNEGDYQISVSPRENTQGHLGLRLSRTSLIDGGHLKAGIPARATLEPGQGLSYQLQVDRAGIYRVKTLGMGRNFGLRLEDSQGWPLLELPTSGDFSQELSVGTYRLVVLPEAVQSRVLTLVELEDKPMKTQGHGPHVLPLGKMVEHVWQEPKGQDARDPDVWLFSLPAPATLNLSLSPEMHGELWLIAGKELKSAATVNTAKPWQGTLQEGEYRLELRHARKNNYAPYQLQLNPLPLLAGQRRIVTIPASIPVAVATPSLVELYSFGRLDVQARLYDDQQRLIAQNDDRLHDWNFHLAQRLTRGNYRLQIDPVGTTQGETTVTMDIPAESESQVLELGKSYVLTPTVVQVYTIDVPTGNNVLAMGASSAENLALSLEYFEQGNWHGAGIVSGQTASLFIPVDPKSGGKYRLKLWSLDRRGSPLKLQAQALRLNPVDEYKLSQAGTPMTRFTLGPQAYGLILAQIKQPGLLRLPTTTIPWLWTDSTKKVSRMVSRQIISVHAGQFLLVNPMLRDEAKVQLQRISLPLAPKQAALHWEMPPDSPQQSVDVQAHQGPVLVVAETQASPIAMSLMPPNSPDDTLDQTLGIAEDSSVTVALSAQALRLWRPDKTGQNMSLKLRQYNFRLGAAQTLSMGIHGGEIKGIHALDFHLPGAAKQIRLVLPPRTAAVLLTGQKISSVHWAGQTAVYESVQSNAQRLLLLHADTTLHRFSVEIMPQNSAVARVLQPGTIFQQVHAVAGMMRLSVQLPLQTSQVAGLKLHVRGANRAWFLSQEGQLRSGTDWDNATSGSLWIQHGSGPVVAWLEGEGLGEDHWRKQWNNLAVTPVEIPGHVDLQGSIQGLSINVKKATLMSLFSPTSLVSVLQAPLGESQVALHHGGLNHHWFLPPGKNQLLLQALGSERLSGQLNLVSQLSREISEGVGPEELIPAGGARIFHFSTQTSRTVGVGVQASEEVVEATLYDGQGKIKGSGIVFMSQLEAGEHYLVISTPRERRPVSVRPVLAGLKPPSQLPPAELIRLYVESKNDTTLIYVPKAPQAINDTVPDASATQDAVAPGYASEP